LAQSRIRFPRFSPCHETFAMNALFSRTLRTALWLGGVGVVCLAQAQGLKASGRLLSPATAVATRTAGEPQTADRIVVVVNSEPITQHDIRSRVQRVSVQAARAGTTLPSEAVLVRQVTDALILERAQIQLANEQGIKVEASALDEAEQNIARQNQMDVARLHRQLEAEGIPVAEFRQNIRQQILVQRLREREVDARVRVTEAEVDRFLAQKRDNPGADLQLHLAQVLVAVPESADTQRQATLMSRAQMVAEKARGGADFAALAREYSDAPDRSGGGDLGLRASERFPVLFVDATRAIKVGGIAGPVRSGAGFHILKVVDKQVAGLPDATVTQTRARHILLRPSARLSEAAAVAQLAEQRARLASGQADFAAVAREISQDSSASQGGDLGWAAPGMFVPEFEEVMNRLRPNELSQPLVSRFGVHLIQVLERKEVALSAKAQRDQLKQLVREQKLEEAYARWLEDVRAGAYVEYREAPQ
jgi:peptidyl-prolyl cis-trans isomerase SurA